MSDMDLSKLKVADLKVELKKRGLPTTGNKNELQDRLQNALMGGGHLDVTDDLLDDDDGLMDDELDEKELLGHDDHEDELLKESPSPDGSKRPTLKLTPAKPTTNAPAAETTPPVQHKKISLKRNLSVPKPVLPETTTTSKTDDDEKTESTNGASNSDEPEKKIVKVAALTAEERLKLRAQKFGATATTTDVVSDERKLARAARFGITSTNTTTAATGNSSASIKNSAPDVSLDVLKKRAERFGAAIAPKLNAVELDEKLKKRQERFGAAVTSSLSSDQAEKARLRLERFKTAA